LVERKYRGLAEDVDDSLVEEDDARATHVANLREVRPLTKDSNSQARPSLGFHQWVLKLLDLPGTLQRTGHHRVDVILSLASMAIQEEEENLDGHQRGDKYTNFQSCRAPCQLPPPSLLPPRSARRKNTSMSLQIQKRQGT
jgi:hypothetical protein